MTKRKNFEEILVEHGELRQLIGLVGQGLAEKHQPRETLLEVTESLQQHLQEHFAHEENDGLFSRIIKVAPWLNDRVVTVQHQHPQLSAAVDKLLRHIRTDQMTPQWWEERCAEYREFTAAFERHEAEENRLLQEAFDRDLGARD